MLLMFDLYFIRRIGWSVLEYILSFMQYTLIPGWDRDVDLFGGL